MTIIKELFAKGRQSENCRVIGMREVIESDFARLQAGTIAAEATAQKEYAHA